MESGHSGAGGRQGTAQIADEEDEDIPAEVDSATFEQLVEMNHFWMDDMERVHKVIGELILCL